MQADKLGMNVLGLVLSRAGSKGLPDKCVRELLGRPVIDYTFDHALSSRLLTAVALTTDSEPAKQIARRRGIEVIDRPAELAIDTATVDSAARHAVEVWEDRRGQRVSAIVLLYGNIPVRPADLIDRAVEKLRATGADSVRSVAPVTKQHPDWVHRLDGDRMTQFRANSIYRRQDLEPLYYHDGAVAAVRRAALFGATPGNHQSFLGMDRRAIICLPEDAVDIDTAVDLHFAEAILTARQRSSEKRAKRPVAEMPCISIGPRPLGADEAVFVIAEAGVNHNGDVETALRMVDAAARAGADAIKFQLFRANDLASRDAATAGYQKRSTSFESQREMLRKLELDDQAFRRIRRRCDECSITFMGTPFSPREVARLTDLSCPAIKIASTDIINYELLGAATSTELPLILSTGAATLDEIDESVCFLDTMNARHRTILLHCVSSYPAPVDSANLQAIRTLASRYGVASGLSDHTTSTFTGGLAVMAGACVIEKHFTLDRSLEGPDHAMSMTPEELRSYVTGIREAQAARGTGRLGLVEAERDVRAAARRSIVTGQNIASGSQITRSMLTLKRPGTGIPPKEMNSLVGRTAVADIPEDTVLSWDMVK